MVQDAKELMDRVKKQNQRALRGLERQIDALLYNTSHDLLTGRSSRYDFGLNTPPDQVAEIRRRYQRAGWDTELLEEPAKKTFHPTYSLIFRAPKK